MSLGAMRIGPCERRAALGGRPAARIGAVSVDNRAESFRCHRMSSCGCSVRVAARDVRLVVRLAVRLAVPRVARLWVVTRWVESQRAVRQATRKTVRKAMQRAMRQAIRQTIRQTIRPAVKRAAP
ncbi:hypothetical protein LMG29739_06374 [Paraburkholderia solisilvae]|uniref:Uncharacterized protein n=1 Tax=Paraburkholderia solisilvae TaxID=624376 RepID=A0A6J5F343_9BURK|nr:hypothetical protein LMG29739_06374 [Paraburkholderia solisilvae]